MRVFGEWILAIELADWLSDGLDVPLETRWAARAIGIAARAHRTLLPAIAKSVLAKPESAPNLRRLKTHAPIVAMLIVWVRRSPRPPLATILVVALLAHAIRHRGLYHRSDTATREHLRQAALAVRKICARGKDVAPELTDGLDAVSRGIEALKAFNAAPSFPVDEPTRSQLARLLSWLQLAEPRLAPTRVDAGGDGLPRLPPVHGKARRVDDAGDRQIRAIAPVEQAVARSASGEVDPEHLILLVPQSLPGARNVVRPGMRLAMDALCIRAAANAAGAGRLGRMDAINPGVLFDLGTDLRVESTPVEARALIAGALYAGMSLRAFARMTIVGSVDEASGKGPSILRDPVALVLPARAAEHLPMPAQEWVANCVPTMDQVILPLAHELPFAREIVAWVKNRGVGERMATPGQLRVARAWLDAHAGSHRSPVTSRRLATVLPAACDAVGIGIAERALLLGRQGGAMGAPSAYFCAQPSHLVVLHVPALALIRERLGGERHVSHPRPLGSPVGSRRVPTRAAVDRYMAGLRDFSLVRPPRRPTLAEQREYHRRLQALVAEVALWCLGGRPLRRVLNGLLDAGEVIAIDEKARPGGKRRSHVRLVPVCRVLREAIAAWRTHRTRVATRFRLVKLPQWFEITESNEVKALAWKQVRTPLPDSGMPRNAARMWWRTRLSELGLRGPMLDAWTGHAGLGNEPGYRLATRAAMHLDPHALELLERMINGLGLPVFGTEG